MDNNAAAKPQKKSGPLSQMRFPTPDEMENMSNTQLQILRRQYQDDQSQRLIAPYEHQAFIRELTIGNPLIGPHVALGLSPLYTAAKAAGLTDKMREMGWLDNDGEKESPPSFEEILRGYKGAAQGINTSVNHPVDAVRNTIDSTTNAAKSAADYLGRAWDKVSK